MLHTVRHSRLLCNTALPFLLLCCMAPGPGKPSGSSAFASALPAPAGPVRIVIEKSAYSLTLYRGDTPVKSYRAVFGRGFAGGDKQERGDRRTPEGDFYICAMYPSKQFYKFLGLSYPGLKHAESALQAKKISLKEYVMIKEAIDGRRQPPWDTMLGGAVGIHGRSDQGSPRSIAVADTNWTDGCIALDNRAVDEIYSLATIGTPVTILP